MKQKMIMNKMTSEEYMAMDNCNLSKLSRSQEDGYIFIYNILHYPKKNHAGIKTTHLYYTTELYNIALIMWMG